MEKIMTVLKSKKEVIVRGALLAGGVVIGGLLSTLANQEVEYEYEIMDQFDEESEEEQEVVEDSKE